MVFVYNAKRRDKMTQIGGKSEGQRHASRQVEHGRPGWLPRRHVRTEASTREKVSQKVKKAKREVDRGQQTEPAARREQLRQHVARQVSAGVPL